MFVGPSRSITPLANRRDIARHDGGATGASNRETLICAGLVCAMTMLGGGPDNIPLPRFLAYLLAATLLMVVVASPQSRWPARVTLIDSAVMASLALVLVQLIPLPPSIWGSLPGRATSLAIDRTVFGTIPWRPLSLDPALTMTAGIALLPALTIYIAVRSGSGARLAAVLAGIMIGAAVTVVLAVLQLVLPGVHALQVYPLGDYGSPIGFFTNHNHQASFLACTLPLVCLFDLQRSRGAIHARMGWRWLACLITLSLLVFATGSRVGAVLLCPAIGLTLGAISGRRLPPRLLAFVLVGCFALFGAIVALGGSSLLDGLHRSALAADPRWEFYPDTLRAVDAYWPVGSGVGTFVQAFAPWEPLKHLGQHYLNHAHDDYLEIALEAGLPGILLAIAMVTLILRAAIAVWLFDPPSPTRMMGRLVAIPPLILLAHSVFDYPLRTISLAMVLAFCVACQSNDALRRNSSKNIPNITK